LNRHICHSVIGLLIGALSLLICACATIPKLVDNKAEAFSSSAQESFNESKYDTALTNINMAISISSNQSSYYIIRGNIHMKKYEKDLAKNDYLKALKLDPKNKKLREHIEKYFGKVPDYSKMKPESDQDEPKKEALKNDMRKVGCLLHLLRLIF
jgi:tetratricopeptide (TPR) repeat protein